MAQTDRACGSLSTNTGKTAISVQNIIRKKEERLKQAPRKDLSVRPTSSWKALRTTEKSNCMEVVVWTVMFQDCCLTIFLSLPLNAATPGVKPATEIHLVPWIAMDDLRSCLGPQASYLT